jgi:hypothetical protein
VEVKRGNMVEGHGSGQSKVDHDGEGFDVLKQFRRSCKRQSTPHL